MNITNLAIAIVDLLSLRTSIATGGHPSCIDDRPPLFLLMTNDCCENGERNVIHTTDTDVVHHQVKKHIHPCPEFSDTLKGCCR